MQLEKFLLSLHPMEITVEYVSILLGAIFREIGTANVSMYAVLG